MTATLTATTCTAPQQHGGNSKGVFLRRAATADLATRLKPVTASVTARQENGPLTDEIGLLEPYRYGDSNPGFRTENWLWEAVCGRLVPAEPEEFA
jgi:hypothetical protein